MTYQRVAYDDASTATEMTSDCRAVGAALHLPRRRTAAERARRALAAPAPSLRYEDHPHDVAKPTFEVPEAAARIAAALNP